MYMRKILLMIIGGFFLTVAIGQKFDLNKNRPMPYLNPKLSIEERVSDLMLRMTVEEKVGQMTQYVGLRFMQGLSSTTQLDDVERAQSHEFYPGISVDNVKNKIQSGEIGSFLLVKGADEANYLQKIAVQSRLKIPLLIAEDAIHGHAIYEGATVFPSPIGLASTFDTSLVKNIAQVTAREMRETGYHWTFSPNVDVARDPRWGRVGETFGEDPFLVGELGKAMVLGYQEDLKGKGVLACPKHFVAGSQPLRGLNFSPMDVSERAMREIWLPPYEEAIKAGCMTVMAAHHDINGVPCHANKHLLQDVLRDQMGFNGFVVTDWLDVSRLHTLHKIAETREDANHLAVNAGIDMNMHGPDFFESVVEQVKNGIISTNRLDEAVRAILTTKFELGLFEKSLVDINEIQLFDESAKELALLAARKSLVLLENKDSLLPLDLSGKKIFITGPNADNQTGLGDWANPQPDDNYITVLEGIEGIPGIKEIDFYKTGDHRNISDQDILETKARASMADISIIVAGDNSLRHFGDERTAGENYARADITLFGRQLELIKAAHAADKPVIVILITGKPTAIPWVKDYIPGVIMAWEPGLMGGQAIAEVLTGSYNPSGKLPISIPRSSGQVPYFYNYRPASFFRAYSDEPTGPLYEFGYGLGFSKLSYSKLTVPGNMDRDHPIPVEVEIENQGVYPAEETVLLFLNDEYSSVTTPVRKLIGFKKVFLQPGEKKNVSFQVPLDKLSLLNVDLKKVVEEGAFIFMVADKKAETVLIN
jgi:beta-glucosidase